MEKKKLLRKDGKFLGVCAGLADYLDVDVTIIRIALRIQLYLRWLRTNSGYHFGAHYAQSLSGI